MLRPYHQSLPKDARTLLKTPRSLNNKIKKIGNGSYFHFGIIYTVSHVFKKCLKDLLGVTYIYMQVNIDGLPLFKSSNRQFWPILGKISSPFKSDPFILGLYSGEQNPEDLDSYLYDFVEEMQDLEHQSLQIVDHSLFVKLDCFVCDAPARAFIKQVKGHNGYHGCEKCQQRGEWKQKMLFPLIDFDKRTDTNIGTGHQTGESPLSALSIGLISQFPLDYMHLVCLGVMRRFLWYWVKSPVAKGVRISRQAIQQISAKLLIFQEYIPREFSRKCRPLSDLDRWKATEFRQFLLYSGIVCLKGQLSTELYDHFLWLFVSIFCLASQDFYADHTDYAHALLCIFVSQCEQLYEKEIYVYNVHCLTHLSDDVKKYGPLDSYSAFPFENFLGQIKRLVRKPQSTLEQVVKRLSEKRNLVLSKKKGLFFKCTKGGSRWTTSANS